MSEGTVLKKLVNTDTDEWEVTTLKNVVRGDRIRLFASKKDAASNKVMSDFIVNSDPFIDNKGNICTMDIISYKEYVEQQKKNESKEDLNNGKL